ncbi:MAG: replication initiator, partial [Phycicoccus sp.]
RRTTIALRRQLAAALGLPESQAKRHLSLQYAKVAEYQARGLVHFHALIRLDGPDGPGSPAPLDGAALSAAVTAAAREATLTAPPTFDHDDARVLAWGAQVDIRTVRDGHRTDNPDSPLVAEQVAGYIAKYSTKDATSVIGDRAHRPHLARLRSTCRELHAVAVQRSQWRRAGHDTAVPLDPKTGDDPYALLGKWAHTLGFRGHFSSKSRRYSITLGQLRRARHRWQTLAAQSRQTGTPIDTTDLERRLLADDAEGDTTLVIADWTYQGTGWDSPLETALALAAAGRAREYAQHRAQQRHQNH